MNDPRLDQSSAIAAFRDLHKSGCFVLPNPWDVGSAVYLRHVGFKALATTSAGFAFTQGLPDSVSAVPRDLMLAHIRDVVEATPLPVSVIVSMTVTWSCSTPVAAGSPGARTCYAGKRVASGPLRPLAMAPC